MVGGVVEVDLVGFVDDGGEEVGEVVLVGEDVGGVLVKGDYVVQGGEGGGFFEEDEVGEVFVVVFDCGSEVGEIGVDDDDGEWGGGGGCYVGDGLFLSGDEGRMVVLRVVIVDIIFW